MDLTINYNQQMLDYYPEVIKAIREFQVLIETQSLQVEDIHNELTKALENAYVNTADDDRIAEWERFLGISPLPQGDDPLEQWLEDRRETILARLYAPKKLNTTSISEIVSIFTGGKATSYFKDGVIHILISPPRSNKKFKFENIEQELKQKIPAHLLFEVAMNYQYWTKVKSDNTTWGNVMSNYINWDEVLCPSLI